MRYIALDPGVTTGIAVFIHNEETDKWNLYALQAKGITWLDNLNLTHEDTVIMENYHIPIGKYFNSGGIETTGAIKAAVRRAVAKLVIQQPSVITFIPKRYEKELDGVDLPIHAKEAMYHGLFYLRGKFSIKKILNDIRQGRELCQI